MPALTWIGPITTGRSHVTYFGSTGAEREVVVITPIRNPANSVPAWEINFTDGSHRTPANPIHLSREAAMAQAEIELDQPISTLGRQSRLCDAFFVTKVRFPGFQKMPDGELYDACQTIASSYDGVTADDIYRQFNRLQNAA